MIKILHVLYGLNKGGAETYVMNMMRAIDKTRFHFDFMINDPSANEYEKEIRSLGGEIFVIPARTEGILKNRRALDAFFKEHSDYDAVHLHDSSISYLEPFVYAKKHGIPVRILHAHSTRIVGHPLFGLLHSYNKSRMKGCVTHFFACSKEAADFFYKGRVDEEQVHVLPNAMDLKPFAFSSLVRKQVRHELHAGDSCLVLGAVARFHAAKNHEFMLEIFKEVLLLHPDSLLVLGGEGALLEDIKKKAKELKIEERVCFLGVVKEPQRLLQAMDAMLMPSLYEGLPFSLLEAQASQVSCFVSTAVPKRACLNENVYQLDLGRPAGQWAQAILAQWNRIGRKQVPLALKGSVYNIETSIALLENLYASICPKKQ